MFLRPPAFLRASTCRSTWRDGSGGRRWRGSCRRGSSISPRRRTRTSSSESGCCTMGIRDWFKRRGGDSGGAGRPTGGGALETGPFFDAPSGKVVQIPAAELRPGVGQARVEGGEGLVGGTAGQLQPREVPHPPVTGGVRAD